MSLLANPDNFYHKIYFESCSEFEEVRELCLEEDNWLRHLYTVENLVLENHHGYSVVYDKSTDEPVGMGGVFNDGRYPKNIARQLHREYLFPKYRQRTRGDFLFVPIMYTQHVVNPLVEINDFDCYIIAMQNRDKKTSKGYWKVFSESLHKADNKWVIGNDYIQTCPWNVQKCWQNYLYNEYDKTGSFTEWNPQLISHEQWQQLEPGI